MLKVLLNHIIIEEAINVLFDKINNNFGSPPKSTKFHIGDLYKGISVYREYNHNPNNPDAIIGCTIQYYYCEIIGYTNNNNIDVYFDSIFEIYHRVNETTKTQKYYNEEGAIHTILLEEIMGVTK